MATLTSIPMFTQRVPMQFFCPDNTALSLDGVNNPYIQNNPNNFTVQTGSVAKIDLGLNGRSYFRGNGEYAPFSVTMSWDCLGYNDYLKLAALRPYPIHMVTFRNIGYYGMLVLSGPQSVKGAGDAVSTTGTFYVLSPSDNGGAASVARAQNPGAYAYGLTASIAPGYLPIGVDQYYWLTFSTIWGETDPLYVGTVRAGSNSSATVTWTWPTDTGYVDKASLYVGPTTSQTSANLISEVPNGLTPTWTDVVGFSGTVVSQQPPTLNTAYRGAWANGIWANEV